MKWLIASDIHGDAECCRAMLSAAEREGASKILILGDILYHGPRNDLPAGYAPKEVIRLLNELSDSILCVRGNCDAEVDQMVLRFPILSETAWIFSKIIMQSSASVIYLKISVSAPVMILIGSELWRNI